MLPGVPAASAASNFSPAFQGRELAMDGRFRRVATVEYQASLGDGNKFPTCNAGLNPPGRYAALRGSGCMVTIQHGYAAFATAFAQNRQNHGRRVVGEAWRSIEGVGTEPDKVFS